jgi:hypothetical protein
MGARGGTQEISAAQQVFNPVSYLTPIRSAQFETKLATKTLARTKS